MIFDVLLRLEVELAKQVILAGRGVKFGHLLDSVGGLAGNLVRLTHLALDLDEDRSH